MTSKEDRSCSDSSDKVTLIMEAVPKDSVEDTPATQRIPSVSKDSVSCNPKGPSSPVTSREGKANVSPSTQRGVKRSFGEVADESDKSGSESVKKSSKMMDSSPRRSSVRTNDTSSEGEGDVQDKDNVTVSPDGVAAITGGANGPMSCHGTSDDQPSINKTGVSIPCNAISDNSNSTTNKNTKLSAATNDLYTSGACASNNSIGKKASTNNTEAKTTNNINTNISQCSTDTTDSEASRTTSNSTNSRACTDISNTSAASNSSDTRSISTTRSSALTLVTSSARCAPLSTSSRDTNNANNNRASSDTNNNNRSAVNNNNSDDSCQAPSTETVRTAGLASDRKVYGLRPRSSVRRLWSTDRPTQEDDSSEPPTDCSIPSDQKPEGGKNLHAASSKSKPSGSSKSRGSRTKPLSKYRRITANARERERMKEINTAFAALRAALPTIADYRIASMTKYTTLQLASSYIRDLSKLLDETPSSDSENKKENCPSYLQGALNSSNRREVNLSVGISELSFERSQQQSGSDNKPGEFAAVFPSAVSSLNSITEEQLEGLGDIENLSDMCWALDFMLD